MSKKTRVAANVLPGSVSLVRDHITTASHLAEYGSEPVPVHLRAILSRAPVSVCETLFDLLMKSATLDPSLLESVHYTLVAAGLVSQPSWVQLPSSLLDLLLVFLTPRDILLAVERTCKTWHSASKDRCAGNLLPVGGLVYARTESRQKQVGGF
jgi:hypothetical protein